MPLTIARLETELLARIAPFLLAVGLDSTTADGTNADLRGPIRRGVLATGITPADLDVADSDIAAVAGWDLEKLLDVAELRALEVCWGNWSEVDEKAGEESQSLNQLADRLERRIAALAKRITEPYVPVDELGIVPGASCSGLITAGRRKPWHIPPDPRAYPGRPGWEGRYRS